MDQLFDGFGLATRVLAGVFLATHHSDSQPVVLKFSEAEGSPGDFLHHGPSQRSAGKSVE
jgi:hypothetical protein